MSGTHDFEEVLREHAAMITRIASSYEAEAHLAEDLVQDISIALWRALPSFRGDASLRTFVARIATNRAITHVARAMKAPPTVELSDAMSAPGGNPERQAIALDRREKLLQAVRALPLAYRQVALLVLEGLTPREIADVLGIRANAVAVRMSRARDMLRRMMGGTP